MNKKLHHELDSARMEIRVSRDFMAKFQADEPVYIPPVNIDAGYRAKFEGHMRECRAEKDHLRKQIEIFTERA